ncbi:helix-turn-helix protein [Arcticibacter tournemirensis]|uniref:Helix-turn-helix transcriptional regulator n=1 Tax=Arcticibacter tournemirensis TaxID=699437 RepID=A0A5M9GKA2_9SPHI|nr:helix-turn-helix transcriptional regulator [Arcticibacter tournemirensis]KAA8474175.1 helix-turn-helix transcriptional regulator [Arcticibacter tournemirensis]TQM49630.1 helix-turn-helix protein [Arcticibacter tournemirensis]
MDIGNTIKKIRIKKGYKQNEFAEKCQLTQAYLSKIENNQKEPTINVLKAIAFNLETPLPVLFFHSLTVDDIEPKKRDAFEIILPSIKGMIESFF